MYGSCFLSETQTNPPSVLLVLQVQCVIGPVKACYGSVHFRALLGIFYTIVRLVDGYKGVFYRRLGVAFTKLLKLTFWSSIRQLALDDILNRLPFFWTPKQSLDIKL